MQTTTIALSNAARAPIPQMVAQSSCPKLALVEEGPPAQRTSMPDRE